MPVPEPTAAQIVAFDNDVLTEHYSMVIGEMSTRHVERHQDRWGPPHDRHDPLLAVDDEELLRIYVAVHDEMLKRHREDPEVWGREE